MTREPCLVPLCDAQAGAVVSEDIKDSAGQLLVPAGTELTEKLLALLERRQVERLSIIDKIRDEEQKQHLIREVQEKLDQQFVSVPDNDTMKELRAMLLRYHCREFS